MEQLKIQLTHPGKQKKFKLGNGYIKLPDNQIIREWCDDEIKSSKKAISKPDYIANPKYQHYRKFIQNNGFYVPPTSLQNKPKKTDLLFWGEWEGHSIFHFNDLHKSNLITTPNGTHLPFHSTKNRGGQNTDPYVFGDFFKYSICRQTYKLNKLAPLSLILFGSIFPSVKNVFYIDTVFVVKSWDTALKVSTSGASSYSSVYKEETLEQLGAEYLGASPSSEKKLYHGLTWWENNEYFSFVPCKATKNLGFERLRIALNDATFNLSSNPQAKSYLPKCDLKPEELWRKIVQACSEQGFLLGVQFKEPEINNTILKSVPLKK